MQPTGVMAAALALAALAVASARAEPPWIERAVRASAGEAAAPGAHERSIAAALPDDGAAGDAALGGSAVTPAAPPPEALPLPPERPWPGLEPPSTVVLPHTGLRVRPLEPLPKLQPRGALASFADERPYADFNPHLDCILDHQRFDMPTRRQKFARPCAPTRDLDVGLPAFTTR